MLGWQGITAEISRLLVVGRGEGVFDNFLTAYMGAVFNKDNMEKRVSMVRRCCRCCALALCLLEQLRKCYVLSELRKCPVLSDGAVNQWKTPERAAHTQTGTQRRNQALSSEASAHAQDRTWGLNTQSAPFRCHTWRPLAAWQTRGRTRRETASFPRHAHTSSQPCA